MQEAAQDLVYVIAPDTSLSLSDTDALRVEPRDDGHGPDRFLRSLAAQRRGAAIGVVLSGTVTEAAPGSTKSRLPAASPSRRTRPRPGLPAWRWLRCIRAASTWRYRRTGSPPNWRASAAIRTWRPPRRAKNATMEGSRTPACQLCIGK